MKQKHNTWLANRRRIISRPVALILARCERALLDKTAPLRYPPVFVLGVPRSGTTLLYQVLVHSFEVAYFCNAAEEHSHYPATVTRVYRSRIRKYRTDFASNYGVTKRRHGPSEGIGIWSRWFPPDTYADEHCLSASGADEGRRTVAAVSTLVKSPFVNKDPRHCGRVRALNALFPGCLFVYMRRDAVANAASILNVRRKRAARGEGDVTTWISVKPKEYASISRVGHISQICGQVYYCARNALDDLTAVAADRHLIVSYEELCAEPRREVDRIAAFSQTYGVPLRQRLSPPVSFPPPPPVPVPEADREAIRAQFAELHHRSGFGSSTQA